MKYILILSVLCFSLTINAQTNTKFGKEVVKMLELSGGEIGFNLVLEEIVHNAKEFRPDIPAEAWKEIESELKAMDKQELYAMVVPIYEKHFTLEEIQTINIFLSTETGKKFSAKLPVLTSETMQAEKLWGITLAKKISERLKDKGF